MTHPSLLCPVLIYRRSVKTFPGANIPSVNRTLFHDRAYVNHLSLRIKVVNPTTVEVLPNTLFVSHSPQIHVLLNINLNASLPQWLISFLINNILSIVMSSLKQQASKVHAILSLSLSP